MFAKTYHSDKEYAVMSLGSMDVCLLLLLSAKTYVHIKSNWLCDYISTTYSIVLRIFETLYQVVYSHVKLLCQNCAFN